jgi:PAS domain S-box-containing protein
MQKILAIDDQRDNLIVLKAITKEAFPEVVFLSASNGALGIELAIAENPDVILLDIAMPEMDGFEVCRRLKLDERVSVIPVVFVTALNATKANRMKALEAGVEAFLTKPIDEIELTVLIKAMFKIKGAINQKLDENKRLNELVTLRTQELEKNKSEMQKVLDELKAEIEKGKEIEASLRESEYFFKQSQHAAFIGSYQADFVAGYWESSEVLDQIFGIDKQYDRSIMGWLNLTHPEDHGMMDRYLKEDIIAQRKPFNKEYRIIRKSDGESRWVHGLGEVAFDTDGKLVFMIGTIQDITERNLMLVDLIEAKVRAEKSDQLKSAFMQNISHEVRTPLNGILGFGELLADEDLSSEERQEYFQVLKNSSDRLVVTINDYMDVSLIVSGNMEVAKSSFLISKILDEIINKFSSICDAKGLTLALVCDPLTSSITLHTDYSLLKKILSRLMNNAVKFTIEGDITLGCIKIDEGVEFFLKDTGVGIKPENMTTIFDNFVQEDMSNTREHEGNGLGLSISQGFIKLLGGEIHLESEKGVGSVFYVTLPVNK